MSRSFTLCVEGLGTKLEWDCGSKLATLVLPSVVQDLHNECKANEAAGSGSCGFVSHKLEGMPAYHMARKLAVYIFEKGAVAKANMLHEFAKVYEEAVLNECGNYPDHISYALSEEVEALLEGEQVRHVPELDEDLAELLRAHAWLISVKVAASR